MASEIGADATDTKQEAFSLLAQGKRHLLVRDYSEAVTSLALASEYLAKLYGENANECGDAYFNYGKALLELARTETGVLGNAMEDKEGSTEDDGDDLEEAENESEATPEQSADESKSSEAEGQKSGDKVTENGVTKSAGSGTSKGDGGDDNETNGEVSTTNGGEKPEVAVGDDIEDDEDDISNLNQAWDMLELAKQIFERQVENDESIELKLAEVHLKLGEVALESENYTEATEDMRNCLQIQEKLLPKDDRCIAETYYQIGVAYSLANQFDEAISAFSTCGKLLELRVSNLKEKIKASVKPDDSDPFYTFEGEIEELEKLFPEIKEKIFDMQDFKNETMKAMMMSHKTNGSGSDPGAGSSKDATVAPACGAFEASSSSNSTSEAKPVTNIGHLVRKKRKSESEPDAVDPKRVCSESTEKHEEK